VLRANIAFLETAESKGDDVNQLVLRLIFVLDHRGIGVPFAAVGPTQSAGIVCPEPEADQLGLVLRLRIRPFTPCVITAHTDMQLLLYCIAMYTRHVLTFSWHEFCHFFLPFA
jgi:hypothetical protein